MQHRVYVGLGSNLDDPQQQVRTALDELDTLPQTRLLLASRLYRSDPVGPPGQPDYINAVALIGTALAPEALLDQLQALEHAHQRVRMERWGPRTLDLDILLYGDQQIATPRLSVPHPFLTERSFVLYPLQELTPELRLPDGSALQFWCDRCPMGTLESIGV